MNYYWNCCYYRASIANNFFLYYNDYSLTAKNKEEGKKNPISKNLVSREISGLFIRKKLHLISLILSTSSSSSHPPSLSLLSPAAKKEMRNCNDV